MNKKITPPRLNKPCPQKPKIKKSINILPITISPEILAIIMLTIITIIGILFVIKFGKTEANIWYYGGL